MKRFILLFNLLFVCKIVIAQITMNALGNTVISKFGIVAFSIGEVFYTNKGNGNGNGYSLFEGIQNGNGNYSKSPKIKLNATIYPNPTKDYIYLKVENLNFEHLQFNLLSEDGKLILQSKIENPQTFISLLPYPAGAYFIKIYRNAREEVSYQILKVN